MFHTDVLFFIRLSENLRNSQTRWFIIILPVKMLGVYPSFRHPVT